MRVVLELLDNSDRAEELMQDFLAFLEGKNLQKTSITLEETKEELEFSLSEEVCRILEYAAYQLEILIMKYFQITLQ